jgi:hypothetical protein
MCHRAISIGIYKSLISANFREAPLFRVEPTSYRSEGNYLLAEYREPVPDEIAEEKSTGNGG